MSKTTKQQQDILEPTSITPSLTSVLNAKKNGVYVSSWSNLSSWKLDVNTDENEINYDYSYMDDSSFASSSSSSSSMEFSSSSVVISASASTSSMSLTSCCNAIVSTKRSPIVSSIRRTSNDNNKRSCNNNNSISVNINEHPLSSTDDDELDEDDEYIQEYCYCDSHLKTPSSLTSNSMLKKCQLKISKSFKKLSDLAASISQSHLRSQQHHQLSSTISTMNLNADFNERLTDDRLPLVSLQQLYQRVHHHEQQEQEQQLIDVVETELELFSSINSKEEEEEEEEEKSKITITSSSSSSPPPPRQRETRINSKFLRIYAHDYSSKLKGQLPYSDDELDYQLNNYLILEPGKKELVKLCLVAREKLWSNVVLPLREDEIISLCDDHDRRFIPDEDTIKLNYDEERRGRRREAKNENVFGVVKVDLKERYQYIKKGWIDERWISITSC